MRSKIYNALLLVTSLFGYLRWGGGNSTFLFEAEAEVFKKMFSNWSEVIHPFTILPLLGQALLLITIFQRTPGKMLTYISIGCLGILLCFICLVGLLARDVKVVLSTIPFLTTAVLTIRNYRNNVSSAII
ncbi:MAG: hypothetical protein LCH81_20980 [Bacteroidetes bacterium]|nr:hypothetical protein [Bacteroidota bacterium]